MGGGQFTRKQFFEENGCFKKKHNALRWKVCKGCEIFPQSKAVAKRQRSPPLFQKTKFFHNIQSELPSFSLQFMKERFRHIFSLLKMDLPRAPLVLIRKVELRNLIQLPKIFTNCKPACGFIRAKPPPTHAARLLFFFTKLNVQAIYKKHNALRRKIYQDEKIFPARKNRRTKSTFIATFSKNKSFSQHSI